MNFEITKELSSAVAELLPSSTSDGTGEIAKRLGLSKEPSFKATTGAHLVLHSASDHGDVHMLGLGDAPVDSSLETTLAGFIRKNGSMLPDTMQIDLDRLVDETDSSVSELLSSLIFGLTAGTYVVGKFKSEAESVPFNGTVQIKCSDEHAASLLSEATAVAGVQVAIRDLVNAPANKLTPEILANWMSETSRSNLTVDVWDHNKIQEEGLEALYAVGKGSEHPPRFIICSYSTEAGNPTVGLVGKGVTFDTGGLSIKPSQSMHLMKSDMAGAAAVLGATLAVEKLALPINLVTIVPTAENSVDATSTRPGDVIGSHSGKTIEVTDTDAEGRLILADGISYLTKNHQPDVIVDMATLTGSAVRALGFTAAAVFSNNDELIRQLEAAGQATRERLWRLPLWSDYDKYLDSDVADVKNFSGKPEAGAISAAKFLEVFTSDHSAWAHIDMAGTAFDSDQGGKEKSATGYGVRLITRFIQDLAIDKIKKAT